MEAKKTIAVSLAALGVAAGIGLGILGGNAISSADKQLTDNTYYQRKQECIQIRDEVNSAESELDYRGPYTTLIPIFNGKTTTFIPVFHPANHPDPLYSIQHMDNAISYFAADAQNQVDMPGLDTRLLEIRGTLPSELDILDYNGARVDDSTFQAERTSLDEEASRIEQVIGNYDSRIPSGLKNVKTNGMLELIGGIILGLGSAGMGMYGFTQDEDYYY